jgi:hypothetical protein
MPNHILRAGKRVPVSFVIRDKFGNDAAIDGVPAWASSNPTALVVEPAADGRSAVVRALGPIGTAQITVTVDADLGDGIRELVGVALIDSISGEANVMALTIGPEEDDVPANDTPPLQQPADGAPQPAPQNPAPEDPPAPPAPSPAPESTPAAPSPEEPATQAPTPNGPAQ